VREAAEGCSAMHAAALVAMQEEAEEQQRAACAASRLAALEENAGLEQQRASLRAQASPSYHP